MKTKKDNGAPAQNTRRMLPATPTPTQEGTPALHAQNVIEDSIKEELSDETIIDSEYDNEEGSFVDENYYENDQPFDPYYDTPEANFENENYENYDHDHLGQEDLIYDDNQNQYDDVAFNGVNYENGDFYDTNDINANGPPEKENFHDDVAAYDETEINYEDDNFYDAEVAAYDMPEENNEDQFFEGNESNVFYENHDRNSEENEGFYDDTMPNYENQDEELYNHYNQNYDEEHVNYENYNAWNDLEQEKFYENFDNDGVSDVDQKDGIVREFKQTQNSEDKFYDDVDLAEEITECSNYGEHTDHYEEYEIYRENDYGEYRGEYESRGDKNYGEYGNHGAENYGEYGIYDEKDNGEFIYQGNKNYDDNENDQQIYEESQSNYEESANYSDFEDDGDIQQNEEDYYGEGYYDEYGNWVQYDDPYYGDIHEANNGEHYGDDYDFDGPYGEVIFDPYGDNDIEICGNNQGHQENIVEVITDIIEEQECFSEEEEKTKSEKKKKKKMEKKEKKKMKKKTEKMFGVKLKKAQKNSHNRSDDEDNDAPKINVQLRKVERPDEGDLARPSCLQRNPLFNKHIRRQFRMAVGRIREDSREVRKKVQDDFLDVVNVNLQRHKVHKEREKRITAKFPKNPNRQIVHSTKVVDGDVIAFRGIQTQTNHCEMVDKAVDTSISDHDDEIKDYDTGS